MFKTLQIVAAAVLFSLFAGAGASAAPLNSSAGTTVTPSSEIVEVGRKGKRFRKFHRFNRFHRLNRFGHSSRCEKVRFGCARHFHVGSFRYKRCVRSRGC